MWGGDPCVARKKAAFATSTHVPTRSHSARALLCLTSFTNGPDVFENVIPPPPLCLPLLRYKLAVHVPSTNTVLLQRREKKKLIFCLRQGKCYAYQRANYFATGRKAAAVLRALCPASVGASTAWRQPRRTSEPLAAAAAARAGRAKKLWESRRADGDESGSALNPRRVDVRVA